MFLNSGGKVYTQTYSGERTEDALTPFCQAFDKKYGPKPGMVSSLPDAYKDGDVVKLDDSNFDDIVLSSNEIWVIKFGAPWCYHCKVFKPKYMEAAEKLGSKVRFGEVDAAGSEWDMVRRWMSSLGFREGRGERAMKYGRHDVRCSGAVELVVVAGGGEERGVLCSGENRKLPTQP